MEALITKLHELLAELKRVKRAGWLKRGVKDAESVADHSFAVTALAIVLADIKGLNTAEVARMAVLHDLPEAVTGDLTPEEKEGKEEKLRIVEEKVIKTLAGWMPLEVGEKYRRAWRRYVAGEGEEARLVRLIDKLEMGLQAARYAEEYSPRKLREIHYSAREAVKEDPELVRALKNAWRR